jgi:hypothetical protein
VGIVRRFFESPEERAARARHQAKLDDLHLREQVKEQYRRPVEERRAAEAAAKDRARRLEQKRRQVEQAHKAKHGVAQTRYSGGIGDTAIPVWHWKVAELPVAFWTSAGDLVPAAPTMAARKPSLKNDPKWMDAARQTAALYKETQLRYGGALASIRKGNWWQSTTVAAGVDLTTTTDEHWKTSVTSGTRKVTVHKIPSITAVRVADDGLRLRVGTRTGDAAARWATNAPLSKLRSAFKSVGIDAERMRVTEDSRGNIVLAFDDLPAEFPRVIAPEPVDNPLMSVDTAMDARSRARWMIGVNARGRVIAPKINQSFPHALVVSGTGGGKSVFCRTLIESLRVGTSSHDGGAQSWQLLIGDGKGTDYRSLAGQPGVLMVSSEPAQHVVLVHRAWAEMMSRYKTAEERKAQDVNPDKVFRFPPLMVLLDEFAVMRSGVGKLGKDSDEFFAGEIDELLRLGREASVVVVISSQDIRVDTIDGKWQENLRLVVSLGQPSKRTLMSDAFGDEDTKRDVERIGSRIVAPGRGVIVQRNESGESTVTQFQSFMGWSPGSVDMASAPTPEVRQLWQRAEQVAARAPRLYPRLGIQVDGPEWRNDDAEHIAATTKTVVLDGKNGPIADRITADPSRPEWLGKAAAKATLGGHDELTFADDDPDAAAPPYRDDVPPRDNETAGSKPKQHGEGSF